MSDKLTQGDKLPKMVLNTIDGQTLTIPDGTPGRYLVLLFYRGNW